MHRRFCCFILLAISAGAGDHGNGHYAYVDSILAARRDGTLPEDSFTLRLRYKPHEMNNSLEPVVAACSESNAPSADLRFAAAVAEFGMPVAFRLISDL